VRGEVWLTETGGIAKFVLPNRRTLFPFSETRQDLAIKRMFRLAARYQDRIKRLYIYNWRASVKKARFDSGIIRHDFITDPKKAPRPAYFTVKRYLESGDFQP